MKAAASGKGNVVMLLSNPGTFDQRPLKEAQALVVSGWRVTILAWDRELETKSDSESQDGLTIKRMRLKAGHGTPYFTVPKLLIFYLWCFAHLLRSNAVAIHCHDVDTLPAGFIGKALLLGRVELVYDMHDLPEAFLRFFPLSAVFQRMFLSAVRSAANLVIVASDGYVPYLIARGFREDQIAVVLNAPYLIEGSPPHPTGDRFRVLYYGGLEEERGVRLIVEALKDLEGVELILAGRGSLETWVKGVASTSNNVRFLGWLNMARLETEIQAADLIPSIYAPTSTNIQLSTPTKLLRSLALSIPAIVPEGTNQAKMVRSFGCGIVVEPGNEAALRRAIAEMVNDSSSKEMMRRMAYDAFRSELNWENMAGRLVQAYERALDPAGQPRKI